MATLDQLSAALVKADAAGNADDAKAFADEIRKMRGAPAAPVAPPTSIMDDVKQGVGNLAAGAIRGAGSIGATILAPYDMAKDALAGKGLSLESNRERRAGMDGGLQAMGAEPDSLLYKTGKLSGEVAGTMGTGGLIARGAVAAAPALATAAPNLLNAIRTSGMAAGSTGGATNALTRAAGGAISGGAAAGMIDPNDVGIGAGVGGALPILGSAVGAGANLVGSALRPFTGKGQDKIAGGVLREFAANPKNALAELARSSEIIPGSAPTTAMAAGDDGIAALSRAMQNASPGYASELAARQTAQNQARTTALEAVSGNTGKIDIAKQARDAATGPMRETVLDAAGKLSSDSMLSSIDRLIAKPDNAGKLAQQALTEFRGRIAQFTKDGEIDARALYAIRKDINEVLGGKLQGEAGNLRYASGQLGDVKGLIDNAIDEASRRVAPANTGTGLMPFGPNISLNTIPAAAGGPRPSWSGYLQSYAKESIPINQMERLEKVMKAVQTGSVDSQGGLILSGAKLNNILKNEGDDLLKALSPEQLDLLRRVSADLNASQIASTTGKSVRSDTLQNMAQNQFLTSALGRVAGSSTMATSSLGRLLQLPYGTANKQIQERLGSALLYSKEAARLMQPARQNKLLELLGEQSRIGYQAAPALTAQ